MRRVLLIGRTGQIGWELERTLHTIGQVMALDRSAIDLANPDSIRYAVRDVQPSLIVNAAAYTAIDKAESEPELVMAVNGIAPGIIAEEAKRIDAAMVHYSTDYVFDGTKSTPYTEEDKPNPLSVYGRTKLAGEIAIEAIDLPHLTLRTSWVYGGRGENFLMAVLRLAQGRDELRVVADQVGAPTWCRTVAEVTAQILARCIDPRKGNFAALRECSGTYNITASGQTSRYGFALAILERVPVEPRPHVLPIRSCDHPSAALRPPNSRLSKKKLETTFGLSPPDWTLPLMLCLAGYKR